MNKFFHLFIFIILSGTFSACDARLSNRLDLNRLQCGSAADRDALIVLRDEQGNPYGAERRSLLRAGILDEGTWTSLAITARSCVAIPPDAKGRIVVEDAKADAAASTLWPEEHPASLALYTRVPFRLQFVCPSEGYAADRELKVQTIYGGEGETRAGLSLSLQLAPASGQPAGFALFQGLLSTNNFPSLLDLSAQASGTYRLSFQAGYLRVGETEAELPYLTEAKGCPLRIIRSQPAKPQILDAASLPVADEAVLVHPLKQAFSITKNPDDQLEVCREAATDGSCTARACLEPSRFQKTDTLTADEAGSWLYFIRSRDAAQHVSETSCTQVKVSGEAPRLSVTWSKPEWAKPFPLLELPPVRAKAQVNGLEHATLSSSDLESQLSCRLTWTSSSGTSRPSRYARCLSGRCEGRNFSDWLPCSPEIDIDLSDEWLRSENWEGHLTLEVRASDGAGHSEEVQKRLWFSGSSLQSRELSDPKAEKSFSLFVGNPSQVASQGRIFDIKRSGEGDQSVSELVESPELASLLQGETVMGYDFIDRPEFGDLWAHWTLESNPDLKIIGRKAQGRWKFWKGLDPDGPGISCDTMTASAAGDLICMSPKELAIKEAQKPWLRFALPLDAQGNGRCPTYALRSGDLAVAADGYWLKCGSADLFFRPRGENRWVTIAAPQEALQGLSALSMSPNQELWLLALTPESEHKVYKRRGDAWIDQTFNFNLEGIADEAYDTRSDMHSFHWDDAGKVRYGPWVLENQKWSSLLPYEGLPINGLVKDQEGKLWTVANERALLRLGPEATIIPLELLGIEAQSTITGVRTSPEGILVAMGQTGFIVRDGTYGVWQFKAQAFKTLAYGFKRIPSYGEFWDKMEVSSEQSFSILRKSGGEIAQLDPKTGWTTTSLANDRPASLKAISDFKIAGDGRNSYLRNPAGELWHWDGQKSYTQVDLNPALRAQLFLSSALADARGDLWFSYLPYDAPLALYRLRGTELSEVTTAQLPADCGGPVSALVDGRLVLGCRKGVYLRDGESIIDISGAFPEIDRTNEETTLTVVPVKDPKSPFVFVTYKNANASDQYLVRYNVLNQKKSTWLIPDEGRLHLVGGDQMLLTIPVSGVILDPSEPERFLATVTGHVLRPEANAPKLVVAASVPSLITAKGGKPGVLSSGLDRVWIDAWGEVWMLAPSLGVLRYDRIWSASDPETKR